MSLANRRMAVALPPWPSVLLDSVAKRGSGHTPDKRHPEYWNGDIKWLSLKDSDRLDNLYVAETAERITPAGIANSSAVEHPPGTVVLTRDAGVGKSAITQDTMAVSQHFMAWQCGEQLDNHFLYYWLQVKKPEFERIAVGNTIKTIGLPYFKALKVPLPPPSEQKAIVAALSDVDALLGALDRLIAKKGDIKQTAMQQLLTGQTRLPGFSGKWETRRLGDHAAFLRSGTHSRAELDEVAPLRYLHYGDIHTTSSCFLDAEAVAMPRLAEAKARALDRLESGDVVLVDASEDLEGVGKAVEFRVPRDMQVVAGLHTIAVRFDRLILADGFKAYLQFIPAFRKHLLRLAAGTKVYATSHRHIADARLDLPGTAEQIAIAAVLMDMDIELSALKQRRDKTRLLKQGMMQELLTGRTRLI